MKNFKRQAPNSRRAGLKQAIYAKLIDTWELSGVPEGEENAKPIYKESVSDADCISNGGAPFGPLPPTYITRIPVDVVMPSTFTI